MLAIVCPGQGSQKPGFLTDWLELPGADETIAALSEATGIDLREHGTVSDEETIKDTAIAQPLIVAAGLLAAGQLFDGENMPDDVVLAGHSVGEITASVLAGALSEADGMRFVRVRSQAMAQAAAQQQTGMTAVLGGDEDDVIAAIEGAGLTPANRNGAGQIVAAGTAEQIAAFAANPPAKARVVELKVAGAFHTDHMAPAVDALLEIEGDLAPSDPSRTLLSNYDGDTVTTGTDTVGSLIAQVSRPVRWDLCMERLAQLGVTGILELPPAGTLVGLAKRGLRGTATFALKSPDDLDAARAFVSEHAQTTRTEGQA